ncbi:hypothetical protein [Actinomadura chokoriensis]|uniref:hypothetical protein n=1 Tax=Actinomadura chokoriensis TaxID=454156 RepID=UPI0031F98EBD
MTTAIPAVSLDIDCVGIFLGRHRTVATGLPSGGYLRDVRVAGASFLLVLVWLG